MGIIDRIRSLPSALGAIPAARVGSPWTDSSHLKVATVPDYVVPIPTREEAMSVPAMLRARNLIVTTIARIPLYSPTGEPLPEWVENATPSDTMPQSAFMRMLRTADDLFFYGQSLWALERQGDTPTAAVHVPRSMWERDENGNVKVANERVAPSDICLFESIHEGVLIHGAKAIRDASRLNAAASRVADTPAALIELRQTNDAHLTDDEIDQLIARYVSARRGKNGGVSYSSPGIEVIEHSPAPESLLISGRNATNIDLARLANLPAPFIDASVSGTSLSYQNAESRMTELIAFGISPVLATIAARLNLPDMNSGAEIAFDTDRILDDIPTQETS